MALNKKYFIAGGAGFIGSHFVDYILNNNLGKVTVYDNYSSAGNMITEKNLNNNNLEILKEDLKDKNQLEDVINGHDMVIHLASNPDIAKAMIDPTIDFYEGTLLTHNIIEAMRKTGIKKIIYASGSGVYGDAAYTEFAENYSPMLPISTYGASKLGCEALICSYCYMFGMKGLAFRFANVVGDRQTHGIGFDFINKLKMDSSKLEIMGDGSQSKSYIHVSDVINAIFTTVNKSKGEFDIYNIATNDYITVNEIADIVIESMHIQQRPEYIYSGGSRGWKGDVPIVRLNSDKIRAHGWFNKYSSKEAIRLSLKQMLKS